MRARITSKDWKDPDTGKAVPQGTIIDGRAARLAFNAGAAQRWGKKERDAFAKQAAKTGAVIKEGLD